MKISLLNSRKCLTASLALFLLNTSSTLASTAPAAPSARVAPAQSVLVQDINANSGSGFAILLSRWENRYGTIAVNPLLSIAKDKRNTDRQRYISLMGAVKLGGPAVAEKIVPLLGDKAWMIRSGTLKALAALKHPKTASAILPLVKDPALVVRVEAIEAIKELRPEGSTRALMSALQSQDNYRFGKAQWVPQRALSALVVLQDRSIVPELRPLLDHQKDPELQRQTIFALSALTGIQHDAKKPLSAQIEAWKKTLTQKTAASAAKSPSSAKN